MSAAPMLEERARTNDDLCTPTHITAPLIRHWGGIALDPCSNPWSVVLAEVELDGAERGDGLTADWTQLAKMGVVFVNPPYSRGSLPRWVDKMVHEAQRRCEIVALVPCSPDTRWWATLMQHARAVVYLHKRIRFQGGRHGAGTFASALVYLGGDQPYLFCHAYQLRGDVRFIR